MRPQIETVQRAEYANDSEAWEALARHDALRQTLWTSINGAAVRLEPFAVGIDGSTDNWWMFAPARGLGLRVQIAAGLISILAIADVVFFAEERALGLRSSNSSMPRESPVEFLSHDVELTTTFLTVDLFCVIVGMILLLWKNIVPKGLVYLVSAPQVPVLLVQATIRVFVYIAVYREMEQVAPARRPVSVLLPLITYMLTLLYILMDVLVSPAPQLRLLLSCYLFVILVTEIVSRSGHQLIPFEQTPPTGISFLDAWLGTTAQLFLKTIDTTTLVTFLTSWSSAALRPTFCLFIKTPCRLSECLIQYTQMSRDNLISGKRRAQRIARALRSRLPTAVALLWSTDRQTRERMSSRSARVQPSWWHQDA